MIAVLLYATFGAAFVLATWPYHRGRNAGAGMLRGSGATHFLLWTMMWPALAVALLGVAAQQYAAAWRDVRNFHR